MSKSYSKIRHILQSNLMLERRMISEKRMIFEQDLKDGEILVTARPQEDVDKGVTDVSFQIMNDVLGQTQYYYKCTADKYTTPAQQVDHEKPGAMYDGNLTLVSAASLGLIEGWKDKLRVGCKSVYDHLANWRKTFCPNLKNKTKPYYDWNCPKAEEPVVAAAETPVTPVTPVERGPTPLTPPTAEQIATFAKVDQKLKTDLTKFYEVRLLSLTKEDLSTPKTDQELETEVKTWNDYLANSGIGLGINGGESFPLSKEMRGYFQRKASVFINKKPNLTQPIKISGL